MAQLTTAQQSIVSYITVGALGIPPGGYMEVLSNILVANGGSYGALVNGIVNSDVFQKTYPTFLSADQFASKYATALLGSTHAGLKTATDFMTAQLNAGVSRADVVTNVLTFLYNAKSDATFGDVATKLANQADVGLYYTIDKQGTATDLTTLQAVLSNVTKENASVDAAKTAISTGNTFTLTTGVDIINGTGGNDTIVADNTGTSPALTVADQLSGGAGVDTLKVYTKSGLAVALPTLSDIETVYVNGDDQGLDISAQASVTALQLDAYTASKTYTVKNQSVSLANHAAGGLTITVDSGSSASQALTLNAVGKAGAAETIDLKGTGASASITTTGAASVVQLTNTGGNLATLNITGDKAVTIAEAIGTLKTINAASATGNVTIDQSTLGADNQLTFTGGAGNDKVTFKAAYLTGGASGDVLDGGAGTDTLVINDTAPVYTAINAAKNFEVLALGTTGATVDVAQVSTIKAFAVNSGVATTTFNNSTNANTYTLDNSAGLTAVTVANAVGQGNADVTINNAKVAAAANTLATLTLTGASTISLTSTNDGQAANTNVITNLVNGDNAAITVKGAADLKFALAAGTAVGSSVDATTFTGKLSVVGSGKSDVLIGGSANDTINGGAITTGVAAVTESAIVDFASGTTHAKDATVILGGLTVTVLKAAGVTGDVLAGAFASLANGAKPTDTADLAFTGNLTGWTTSAVANTDQVTFTSTTANTDVTNLANTGTASLTSITITPGNNGTAQSVDTLTGNGGNDVFVFSNANLDTAAAAGAVTAVITDFKTGVDSIKDTTVNALGSATNYVEATTVAASMSALYTAADTALDAAAVKYYVGQVGSDTYVFTDNDANGFTNVIKLTGVALDGIAYTDFVA